MIKDNNDHILTEFESFLENRLNDKYLVFTSKINFIHYQNNVNELIILEEHFLNQAKKFFKENKYKDIVLLPPPSKLKELI